MKLLVISDRDSVKQELTDLNLDFEYLDLRKGFPNEQLMDVYEIEKPELCRVVRQEIETINPDKIVVVGGLTDYVWLGTIVTRLFGQFNSWNGQRENAFGKTVLTINGNEVPLYAIYQTSDWRYVDEA
ncbi:hypothetical protein PT250_02765 [Erysipelothrix rhusiopathiae]|uniref:Uncharacterized protein n=1 Tax=Erysipelothrix rhusiopathiae ATCC 19414 TaxID=525280 RepID=E7FUH8_ERYRH|nr:MULTISPECIES: hypothetical protein [Erysipelothrix]UPU39368.1 hypothetical protein MX850_00720 [Erysipelothrix sp. Poltava]AGN23826.1 hypothetical protein K210_00935 [Erysipelothrix rhusiopathiae SY1027]AMS11363.1 hypothetical protein A2I91_06320 [Erysipelothrix rhusiopathiae]AOO67860.1 hypothetical protein BC346_05840 [Erysipelothrix rhusiopathiae]AWU41289.1 hypothetical protein DM789_03275 [Erysipelothrix rhusiopathiae]